MASVSDPPREALGVEAPRRLPAGSPELALALLTAVALALRVTSLSRSLFNDETVSFALSQRGFGHMLALFGYEANGTPYAVLLWPVQRIFGTSVAVLRAPAVLAGVASVPALYWAVRGYVEDRRVALLSAALLALNPMAVWYSQVARSYAFVALGACLALGALARASDRPSRRGMWTLFVLATALVAYGDLFAAPLLVPVELLLAWRARRPGLVRVLAALAAAAALCVPLLIAAAISRGHRDGLYWLPHLSRGLVELALQEFSGGFSGVSAVRWVTLLAGVVLLGCALATVLRAGRARQRHGYGLLVACAWGVLPPVVLLAISAKVAVFWPRYSIVALPGLCLLAALAVRCLLEKPRMRVLALGALGVLLVAGAYADARQLDAVQQNWLPAAPWLRTARAANQPVILDTVLTLPSLGYYDPALRAPDGELVVEEWHDTPLPRGVYAFQNPTGYGGAPDGPPSVALVRRLARAGGVVWLVFGEIDTGEQGEPAAMPAVRWLRANCHVRRVQSTGVEVLRAGGCRQ